MFTFHCVQNTHNNSLSVEHHRLKCSIGPNVTSMVSNTSAITDTISKVNSNFSSNGGMVMDVDRQWLHVSNSVIFLIFISKHRQFV